MTDSSDRENRAAAIVLDEPPIEPGALPPSPYDYLDPDRIIGTAEKLTKRIHERFPESGLLQVSHHIARLARDARRTAAWIGRPQTGLRVVSALLVLVIVLGVAVSVFAVPLTTKGLSVLELVAAMEAGINDVVLIGAGIFFLVTLETRIKRNRALRALHKLRSVAHIIDMHQLSKTPEHLASHQHHQPTESSPQLEMTAFELHRYLDYCTELLSLTGKVAAVYIQDFDDGVATGVVNEIEELTTGLTRKIWQKLVLLERPMEKAFEVNGFKQG